MAGDVEAAADDLTTGSHAPGKPETDAFAGWRRTPLAIGGDGGGG